MKGKNKENSSYKIKVNKTLIHKKSICNLKNIGTPNKISSGLKNNNNDIIQRNSFSRKIKKISTIDFDSNDNSAIKNYYSQKTYTCNYLLEDNTYNTYKAGNIFYDIQKNKYLKPMLDSKDIQKKILKCQITEPLSSLYNINNINNIYNNKKCLSELQSPKEKEFISFSREKFNNNSDHSSIIKIKNENIINKNTYYLLNNLKICGSNYPIKFLRNNLNNNNDNYTYYKKNEINLNNYDINSNQQRIKRNKTCKNFYYKNTNYEPCGNNSQILNILNKYSSISNKYRKSTKNLLNDKIRNFCNILERFFLNIIKKMFKRLVNELNLIKNKNKNKEKNFTKINSETNTRRNTAYDLDTIKTYKNSRFNRDTSIKGNSFSSINYLSYENSNNLTNRFDRDIIGNSKEKKNENKNFKTINHLIKNKLNNEMRRNEIFGNNNNSSRTNNKYVTLKKLYADNSGKSLIYHRKTNFSYKKEKSIKKDNNLSNNKTLNITGNNNVDESLKVKKSNNTICFNNIDEPIIHKKKTRIILVKKKRKSNIDINKNKKLFMNYNYYIIRDFNYKKIFINKYTNKNKNDLSFFRNINFSIIQKNESNLNKKLKINDKIGHKKNNTISNQSDNDLNKTKKILYINNHSLYNKDDTNIKNISNYNNNKNTKKIINYNYNFNDRNDKIKKIIINCAKFLIYIIRKLLVKKYFIYFIKMIKKI